MGCDIHPIAQVRINGKWHTSAEPVPEDRDYRTFALLAGVRNYTTDPEITPISKPRGLPQDCGLNPDDDDLGDHSYSWLTLAELLTVDMDQQVTMVGIVSPEAAAAWRERGERPESWCHGTSDRTWQEIRWPQSLRETLHLFPMIVEALKLLGAPEDVRLVFGFDS